MLLIWLFVVPVAANDCHSACALCMMDTHAGTAACQLCRECKTALITRIGPLESWIKGLRQANNDSANTNYDEVELDTCQQTTNCPAQNSRQLLTHTITTKKKQILNLPSHLKSTVCPPVKQCKKTLKNRLKRAQEKKFRPKPGEIVTLNVDYEMYLDCPIQPPCSTEENTEEFADTTTPTTTTTTTTTTTCPRTTKKQNKSKPKFFCIPCTPQCPLPCSFRLARFPFMALPQPGLQVPGIQIHGLPVPGMPIPGMPVPGMPIPGLPLSGMQAPGMPLPGMPGPGMPIQEMSLPGMPIQGMPMRGMPIPGMLQPGMSRPGIPGLGMPIPGMPAPGIPQPAPIPPRIPLDKPKESMEIHKPAGEDAANIYPHIPPEALSALMTLQHTTDGSTQQYVDTMKTTKAHKKALAPPEDFNDERNDGTSEENDKYTYLYVGIPKNDPRARLRRGRLHI